jgi:hypothetical protein
MYPRDKHQLRSHSSRHQVRTLPSFAPSHHKPSRNQSPISAARSPTPSQLQTLRSAKKGVTSVAELSVAVTPPVSGCVQAYPEEAWYDNGAAQSDVTERQ